MRTLLMSTAICLSILLAGCGKQNSNNSSGSLVQEIPASDLQSAQDIAKSSAVSCADSSSCNPSIGMLVATKPASLLKSAAVITCTAFSVGPDLVLTNSHCVPGDLKNPLHFSSCGERLKVVFPTSGSLQGEEITCDHVVSYSQSKAHDLADYALIKLKSATGRPSLTIDSNGIAQNQNFTFFKIDPINQQEPKGTLKKASCFATEGSYVLPSYSSTYSLVASLAGCDAIPGNSGSPLISEKGTVSGIFQDIVTPDPSALQALSKYLADPNLANQIFATNLACANIPAVKLYPAPQCSSNSNAADSINLKELEASSPEAVNTEQSVDASFDSWQSQNNKIFHWQLKVISESTLDRRSIFLPDCFANPASWISDYPRAWYDLLHSYEPNAEIDYKDGLPEVDTKFALNRYLQPEAQTSGALSKTDMVIQFTPNVMATENAGYITVLENKQELLSFEIHQCSK